jgi:hypothetical protein
MSKWKKPTTVYVHPTPLMTKCDQCGKAFDWRYGGLINMLKVEFCGHECFDDYLKERKRLRDEFQSL